MTKPERYWSPPGGAVILGAELILGLALRLYLSPLAVHGDLIMQSGWGWWISEHGVYKFYENNIWIYSWPNHPPLASIMYGLGFNLYHSLNTLFTYISTFIALHRIIPTKFWWWFDFVRWFGQAGYNDTPYKYGEFISMKLFPIVADLVLAVVIYKLAERVVKRKQALLLTMVYLFSPFSWYLSSLWGQTDQLGFVLALVAFLFLLGHYEVLAPIVLAISIGIKPTTLIFVPLFLWIAWGERRRIGLVIVGTGLTLSSYFLLVKGMSDMNFIDFNRNLQTMMFAKGEWWTWANSFNFWHLVTGYLTSSWNTFLFIPYKIWGYGLFTFFYLMALLASSKRNVKSMLIALFVVAFSAWQTMVTMHERYLFPAVVLGLILTIYNKLLFKYWLVLSLIFALNLYNDWWAPVSIEWVRSLMMWQERLVPRILSLATVLLFLRMVTLLVSEKELKASVRSYRQDFKKIRKIER